MLRNAQKHVEIFRRCLFSEQMTMEQIDVIPRVAFVTAKQLLQKMDTVTKFLTMAFGCTHTFKISRVINCDITYIWNNTFSFHISYSSLPCKKCKHIFFLISKLLRRGFVGACKAKSKMSGIRRRSWKSCINQCVCINV